MGCASHAPEIGSTIAAPQAPDADDVDWQWSQPFGETELYGVFGWGDTVIAVGTDGLLARYDRPEWRRLDSGTTGPLVDVWGSGESDFYVVGPSDGLHMVAGEPERDSVFDATGVAISDVHRLHGGQSLRSDA